MRGHTRGPASVEHPVSPTAPGAGRARGPSCSFSSFSSAVLKGGFPLLPPPPDPFLGLRSMRHTPGVVRSGSSHPVQWETSARPGQPLVLFTCQILPILQSRLEAHLLLVPLPNLRSPSPHCFLLPSPPTSSSNPKAGIEEHPWRPRVEGGRMPLRVHFDVSPGGGSV